MNYSESSSLRLDQLRAGVVALEKASSEASSLTFAREGLVTNFLSSVFSRASVALSDFVSAVYPKADLATASSFTISDEPTYTRADYTKLRSAPLTTMEGFEGKYLPYGKVVLTSLSYYKNVLDPQMKQFRTLLGSVINNLEDRRALMSLESRYKAQKTELEGFDRDGAAFWSRGSYKSIHTVGDVVERSGDLVEIMRDGKAIANELKTVNFEEVQGRVKEIRDLIRIAVEAIDAGNLKGMSDAQLKNLSFGVMSLAESVEFFGLTLYRANVYLTALGRLQEAVKKFG